jgi:Peptidase family S41
MISWNSWGILMPIFLLLILPNVHSAAQEMEYRYSHLFTPEECITDLKFYKEKLENEHPNLYLYARQAQINSLFDSIAWSMQYPLNSVNFFNLLTLIPPLIQDGHTHIFPDPATTEYNNTHARFLPFDVHWENGRAYIIKDYSSGSKLSKGTEILIINGVSSSFLYEIMLRRLMRDGYNLSYPKWIMEQWFPEYYSYHIGNPSSYTLYIRKPDQSQSEIILEGMPKDSIAYYRRTRYNEPSGDKIFGTGLTMTVDTALHTATLTIKDFHNDILRQTYNQRFTKVIPAFFEELATKEVSHLILDLRNNQGGDIENGILLLSHLLDTTFEVVKSYEVVDPLTQHIPIARTKPGNGPGTGLQKPTAHPFNGKLYVLVNGGTFSASGAVSAILKAHQRCIFIGEETGGNPAIFSGGGSYIQLPNTKTKILIPPLRFNILSHIYNNGSGIIPDYPVAPTLSDILSGKDPALQLAYKLIMAQQKE